MGRLEEVSQKRSEWWCRTCVTTGGGIFVRSKWAVLRLISALWRRCFRSTTILYAFWIILISLCRHFVFSCGKSNLVVLVRLTIKGCSYLCCLWIASIRHLNIVFVIACCPYWPVDYSFKNMSLNAKIPNLTQIWMVFSDVFGRLWSFFFLYVIPLMVQKSGYPFEVGSFIPIIYHGFLHHPRCFAVIPRLWYRWNCARRWIRPYMAPMVSWWQSNRDVDIPRTYGVLRGIRMIRKLSIPQWPPKRMGFAGPGSCYFWSKPWIRRSDVSWGSAILWSKKSEKKNNNSMYI